MPAFAGTRSGDKVAPIPDPAGEGFFGMRGEGSSPSARPNPMSDADTMKKTGKHDWSRFDALTDEEAHAAALADSDAQPLTEERLARLKRVPRARTLRRRSA